MVLKLLSHIKVESFGSETQGDENVQLCDKNWKCKLGCLYSDCITS
jgi:hypothetical protein